MKLLGIFFMTARKVIFAFAGFFIMTAIALPQQLLPTAELDLKETYTSFTKALEEPDKVYKLDLSFQGLKQIPDSIVLLKNLQILILSDNELDTIPDFIGNLVNLQELIVNKKIGRAHV